MIDACPKVTRLELEEELSGGSGAPSAPAFSFPSYSPSRRPTGPV